MKWQISLFTVISSFWLVCVSVFCLYKCLIFAFTAKTKNQVTIICTHRTESCTLDIHCWIMNDCVRWPAFVLFNNVPVKTHNLILQYHPIFIESQPTYTVVNAHHYENYVDWMAKVDIALWKMQSDYQQCEHWPSNPNITGFC